MPFAPIGFTWRSSSSTRITSIARTSAFTGTRYSPGVERGVGPEALVVVRRPEQRHAEALHDAAEELAARGLGVEDPAAGEGAHDLAHPHEPEIRIDAHLGELRAERVRGVLLLL